MHELWLCKSILEIIKQQATERSCRRVKKVYLEIGQLAAIDPSSLLFCFSLITHGTIADQATLEIISVPGEAFCEACQKNMAVKQYYDACHGCGSLSLTITKGEELRVKSMEVE